MYINWRIKNRMENLKFTYKANHVSSHSLLSDLEHYSELILEFGKHEPGNNCKLYVRSEGIL